jgi:EpsI family protein
MSTNRLRAFFVMLVMFCASAIAQWMMPTVFMSDTLGKPDLETLFPKEFDGWRLDARAAMVLPSPDTQALLNSIYNQTLTRTYINASGYRIMLSVAYGGDQSDGTRAHVPEVCYPAQGFQITANTSGQLVLDDRKVAIRHLMAKYGTRDEPITYWLLVGDRVTVSRTDQKLAQFRLGLKGLIPDGMLIRVSSIDSSKEHGYEQQATFLADLAAAVPLGGRDRVFGTLKNE